MTARTDRSDPGRYSPAYATGREFGEMRCRGLLEGAKGLTLHPSRGLPKRGQRVYPLASKGLPKRDQRVNPRRTWGSESDCRRSAGGGNGKIYGKGMNAVRQISRRFGRTTGTRTRSAADCSITATLSVVPDPLETAFVFFWVIQRISPGISRGELMDWGFDTHHRRVRRIPERFYRKWLKSRLLPYGVCFQTEDADGRLQSSEWRCRQRVEISIANRITSFVWELIKNLGIRK